MVFNASEFLPAKVVARITDIRVNDPDRARRAAVAREKRSQLTFNGKLNIIAADHPARGATRVGTDELRMADRPDLLARLIRVLIADAADGVLASLDVIEDLLIVHDLVRSAGGPAFLDSKVLLVSLNRAGLAGSSWELDDPCSGPDPETLASWRFDATKLLLRIDLSDRDSLKTLLSCAEAVNQSNAASLPVVMEPLPVTRTNGAYRVITEAPALAKAVSVATALGNGSTRMWLKLPACDDYEVVARSTTLPILILGGEVEGDRRGFFERLEKTIAAAPNVRGTMIGRNALYPEDGDPLALARAMHGLVHEGWSADEAVNSLQKSDGEQLDALQRWL